MTKAKSQSKSHSRKFKALEKNAKNSPVKDIQWEGEELQAKSKTVLEDDRGTGQTIVLRFFDFGANVQTFKDHKPTAQDLFNGHRKGMESLLWRDGLRPFDGVEPRLMFSKDKSHYRFVIACVPTLSNVLVDSPQTLSQLIKK